MESSDIKKHKNVFLPDTLMMIEQGDEVAVYNRETGRVVRTFKKSELDVNHKDFKVNENEQD